MTDVESYIFKFDENKRARLLTVRAAVKKCHPDCTERIYFGMPTVEKAGKIILHYAAYKKHISLIVGYELAAYLAATYPQYRYTRATVIFPDDAPLPEAFIDEVCAMAKSEEA